MVGKSRTSGVKSLSFRLVSGSGTGRTSLGSNTFNSSCISSKTSTLVPSISRKPETFNPSFSTGSSWIENSYGSSHSLVRRSLDALYSFVGVLEFKGPKIRLRFANVSLDFVLGFFDFWTLDFGRIFGRFLLPSAEC